MAITINGAKTNKIVFKQKEGKKLSFTYNVSIAAAEFSLICTDNDDNIKFTKVHADFDISLVGSRIVAIVLTTTDLDLVVDSYNMELKAVWHATDSVDKTTTMKLQIIDSLFN